MHAPMAAATTGKNQGNISAVSAKEESMAGGVDAMNAKDTSKSARLAWSAVEDEGVRAHAHLPKTSLVQLELRAARAASCMMGAVRSAGIPLQISSALAPWWTSIASPLAFGMPR